MVAEKQYMYESVCLHVQDSCRRTMESRADQHYSKMVNEFLDRFCSVS